MQITASQGAVWQCLKRVCEIKDSLTDVAAQSSLGVPQSTPVQCYVKNTFGEMYEKMRVSSNAPEGMDEELLRRVEALEMAAKIAITELREHPDPSDIKASLKAAMNAMGRVMAHYCMGGLEGKRAFSKLYPNKKLSDEQKELIETARIETARKEWIAADVLERQKAAAAHQKAVEAARNKAEEEAIVADYLARRKMQDAFRTTAGEPRRSSIIAPVQPVDFGATAGIPLRRPSIIAPIALSHARLTARKPSSVVVPSSTNWSGGAFVRNGPTGAFEFVQPPQSSLGDPANDQRSVVGAVITAICHPESHMPVDPTMRGRLQKLQTTLPEMSSEDLGLLHDVLGGYQKNPNGGRLLELLQELFKQRGIIE